MRSGTVAHARCSWEYVGKAESEDPRRLDVVCDDPNVIRCRDCGREALARCGTARESKCPPCSAAYVGRVGVVAGSGYRWSPDHTFFLTLTAPGGVSHRLPSGQLCPCTPRGGVDLPAWNADAGRRWNRFVTELRREYGETVYFKATEVQRRGALHLHVLIRFDAAPFDRAGRPLSVASVRRMAVKHGFGHSVDLQGIAAGHAAYVAKYVAKAADARGDVPWRGTKLQRGKPVVTADGELLGYVFPNGDLEDRTRRRWPSWSPSYKTWTASRTWGESMAAVRAAQSHWQACLGVLDGLDTGPELAELAPRRPDGPPPGDSALDLL
jgi:hypothetical protein